MNIYTQIRTLVLHTTVRAERPGTAPESTQVSARSITQQLSPRNTASLNPLNANAASPVVHLSGFAADATHRIPIYNLTSPTPSFIVFAVLHFSRDSATAFLKQSALNQE